LGIVAIKVIRGDLTKGKKPVNPRASLKWVLQDSNVHATIPGFSNFEEMNEDLSIMEDLSLTEAEKNEGISASFCDRFNNQCKSLSEQTHTFLLGGYKNH